MKIKVEEYSIEKDDYIEIEYEILARYKYIGKTDKLGCINGKIYNCVGYEEDGSLKIVDEEKEPYLYSADNFKLVEDFRK